MKAEKTKTQKEQTGKKQGFFLPAMVLTVVMVVCAIVSLVVLFALGRETKMELFGENIFSLTINVLIPVMIAAALLSGVCWWKYIRSRLKEQEEITSQIATLEIRARRDQDAILRLMDELAEFSNGDLTIEAQVTEDFTGAIADSVNYAIESMRDLVGTINRTSTQVSSASRQTQTLAEQMRQSTATQTQQISDMARIIGEMVRSLDRVALSTTESAEIARESVKIARNGSKRVQDTIGGMNKIREHIQDTSKRIKRLGESSQEIGNIVEIIKGIADQTSILALNAAIQASSAGEAGKGFAVVADEVQKLAERSTNATRRIESLVTTIQGDTNEAIHSMEKSTMEVVNGADIAEQAGGALSRIEEVSTTLASLIDRVSQSTRSVSERAQDVSKGMGSINEIAEKTTENVDETSDAINNLSRLSEDLENSVSHFTLPQDF